MAYRQTTTYRVQESEFKELFDIKKNTFYKHKAYSWYDPTLIYETAEDMRDDLWIYADRFAVFWQCWWEDDLLIGFRMFTDCRHQEDFSGGMVHTAGPNGPLGKILGGDNWKPQKHIGTSGIPVETDLDDWRSTTLKTDVMIGRPDSTGDQHHWMLTRPEISPVWDNNDGESVHQAMWQNGYERAYACQHGKLQKQLLWGARECESLKYDRWLKHGYAFNERQEVGFNVDEQTSFIYRLVGAKMEWMGWPMSHPLYHKDDTIRPDLLPRPYIASRDEQEKLGIQPAPIPPGTTD